MDEAEFILNSLCTWREFFSLVVQYAAQIILCSKLYTLGMLLSFSYQMTYCIKKFKNSFPEKNFEKTLWKPIRAKLLHLNY